MIILFISLCLIILGLFLSLAVKGQRKSAPVKIQPMENHYERQINRIIDDISMS